MMLAARHVILGTAGHIDHGKTALVYALTGTDTDRLPEEKQRGITIDLGFASLVLRIAGGEPIDISIIDVPGHHAFVRNMLAGAGGIDCVLLVIAADEGVMPQTREHLAICKLLGIRSGVVALTKKDCADDARLNEVIQQVRAFVAGSFLEDAPILPVSAVTGEGIAELKSAMGEAVSAVLPRSEGFLTRLPVDRAFSVRGFGTVVTGTLQSGTVRADDTLQLEPRGTRVRVRRLQMHNETVPEATAPCRAALNLAGVDADQVKRGDVLVPPETVAAVNIVDAEISLLPEAPSLKHRVRVRFHAFTGDAIATVLLYGQTTLKPGETAIARLQLAKSMVLLPGDRFVLRSCSPAATIGGGRVLDGHPLPRTKKQERLQQLQQLSHPGNEERCLLRISRQGRNGITLNNLQRETGLTLPALRARLNSSETQRTIIALGDFLISRAAVDEAANSLLAVVQEAKGTISTAELLSRTGLKAETLQLGLDALIRKQKIERSGNAIRLFGQAQQLPESTRRILAAVESAYFQAGLAPPLLSQLKEQLKLSDLEVRESITHLLRSKRLLRLGADGLFIHSDALDQLYGRLKPLKGQPLDVGRFKSLTGLTRKHAIPLLEHLDRVHITRNNAGSRTIL